MTLDELRTKHTPTRPDRYDQLHAQGRIALSEIVLFLAFILIVSLTCSAAVSLLLER